jgi:hypothetical protein
MVKQETDRVARFLAQAKRHAEFVFRREPNKSELVADTVSTAWVMMLTMPPDAKPSSVARYAAGHVKVGRQFQESARSMTGPNPSRSAKPRRIGMHLEYLATYGG